MMLLFFTLFINANAADKRGTQPWKWEGETVSGHMGKGWDHGTWGDLSRCDGDSFFRGFRVKIEDFELYTPQESFDDKRDQGAMNGLEFLCENESPMTAVKKSGSRKSKEVDFGTWSPWYFCPENQVITATKVWSEKPQGGKPEKGKAFHEDRGYANVNSYYRNTMGKGNRDDTAMNNIFFGCSEGGNSKLTWIYHKATPNDWRQGDASFQKLAKGEKLDVDGAPEFDMFMGWSSVYLDCVKGNLCSADNSADTNEKYKCPQGYAFHAFKSRVEKFDKEGSRYHDDVAMTQVQFQCAPLGTKTCGHVKFENMLLNTRIKRAKDYTPVVHVDGTAVVEEGSALNGLKFIGCFVSHIAGENSADMKVVNDWDVTIGTVVDCQSICKRKGMRYSAMQNGDKCLCGHDFNTEAKYKKVDDKECFARTCNGAACGAPFRNAVYQAGKFHESKCVESYHSSLQTLDQFGVLCPKDEVLQSWQFVKGCGGPKTMSIRYFCIHNDSAKKHEIDTKDIDKNCSNFVGKSLEWIERQINPFCPDGYALRGWKVTYVGCQQDGYKRIRLSCAKVEKTSGGTNGYLESKCHPMTNKKLGSLSDFKIKPSCSAGAALTGFTVASCDGNTYKFKWKCLNIKTNDVAPAALDYVGCYKDISQSASGSRPFEWTGKKINTRSPAECMSHCLKNGRKYSAVQGENQMCLCGHHFDHIGKLDGVDRSAMFAKVDDSECLVKKCKNSDEPCGNTLRNAVYRQRETSALETKCSVSHDSCLQALDQLDIMCERGSVMTDWKFEKGCADNKMSIKYNCAKIPTKDLEIKEKDTKCSPMVSSTLDVFEKQILPFCPSGYALQGWKVHYVGCAVAGEKRLKLTCAKVPSRQVEETKHESACIETKDKRLGALADAKIKPECGSGSALTGFTMDRCTETTHKFRWFCIHTPSIQPEIEARGLRVDTAHPTINYRNVDIKDNCDSSVPNHWERTFSSEKVFEVSDEFITTDSLSSSFSTELTHQVSADVEFSATWGVPDVITKKLSFGAEWSKSWTKSTSTTMSKDSSAMVATHEVKMQGYESVWDSETPAFSKYIVRTESTSYRGTVSYTATAICYDKRGGNELERNIIEGEWTSVGITEGNLEVEDATDSCLLPKNDAGSTCECYGGVSLMGGSQCTKTPVSGAGSDRKHDATNTKEWCYVRKGACDASKSGRINTKDDADGNVAPDVFEWSTQPCENGRRRSLVRRLSQ